MKSSFRHRPETISYKANSNRLIVSTHSLILLYKRTHTVHLQCVHVNTLSRQEIMPLNWASCLIRTKKQTAQSIRPVSLSLSIIILSVSRLFGLQVFEAAHVSKYRMIFLGQAWRSKLEINLQFPKFWGHCSSYSKRSKRPFLKHILWVILT